MDVSIHRANGIDLAVRSGGSGDPLVCLHAIGHGARDFERLAERLGDRFRVIAPDWPGHGESAAAAIPPEAGAYAALLPALLDALAVERAIVLGNSIGGAAAIHFAANHLDRVRALVLVDSGGLVPLNWLTRFAIRRQAARFARGAAGDPSFPAWYASYYDGMLSQPEAAWRRGEIVAEGPKLAPLLAEGWRRFAEPPADLRALMPRLTQPVLCAWGRHDPAIPWSFARRAARSAPECTVALFDCGHCPFIERPAEFDTALVSFVAGFDGDPG
jgi:4,5:9,10-diseco-3-hydroxy-5,9,17-trioxoandrosta-1(10),2-diene-4-oate hydrolase